MPTPYDFDRGEETVSGSPVADQHRFTHIILVCPQQSNCDREEEEGADRAKNTSSKSLPPSIFIRKPSTAYAYVLAPLKAGEALEEEEGADRAKNTSSKSLPPSIFIQKPSTAYASVSAPLKAGEALRTAQSEVERPGDGLFCI